MPWETPPPYPVLGECETHVWRVTLQVAPHYILDLSRLLAADEAARAARFRFARDHDRFIVARAALRSIVGLYVNQKPGEVTFVYGQHGKPALAMDAGTAHVQFNMSHSDGLALCGVTLGRQIGIDVERIRPEIADETIAEHYFSQREISTLRALPPALQTEAFFTCWTRKEAYIKATGKGLALPLAQFDVSMAPGEPAALLSTRPDLGEARRWSMHHLEPGEGYAAALVVEGAMDRVVCWQWDWADDPSAPPISRAL